MDAILLDTDVFSFLMKGTDTRAELYKPQCSRECRDGAEAHEPGTCKGCGARLPEGKRRGSLYCDAACKQNAHRSRTGQLSVTNTSIYAGFCTGKQAPAMGIAGQ